MLKQGEDVVLGLDMAAAAFGRLCVETTRSDLIIFCTAQAAAFGRLCVETEMKKIPIIRDQAQPPSGGCVLKLA